MGKESVIFAGCARDCEQYLPSVLKNVDRISSLFSQSAFLICENDSTDATRKILSDWGSAKTNFDLANLDGLVKSKTRTMRLEFARNALVEIIRSWEVVNSFKYLFLLDFDKANIRELDVQQLSTAMEWMTAQKNIAAIFPNQIGPYYDMWALRHQTYCPTDVWEEALDYYIKHQCEDEEAFQAAFARRMFTLPQTAAPLEVDSAFGGFGLYRLNYYLNNRNPYLGSKVKVIRKDKRYAIVRCQQCEHVHFHAGIRNLGGKLFVMPGLINGDATEDQFPPSYFRGLIF